MGIVLLAHDTALGCHVAVKLVPEAVVKDSEAIANLRKEVLRGMALTHSGIVRTHNFECDENEAGIVMEYVEGDTLAQLKQRQPGGCFEPEQILPWIEQLCAVLDYAHCEARIVHRDLKPQNIMITTSGRIKVADFGISATLSDSMSNHSIEGKLSGTLSYMSPQQAVGMRPTHLDDIHALGATIYDLLTGKPPFFRGNQASVHAQVINVVPRSMADLRADLEVTDRPPIPAEWEDAIAACLAKDPADRPATAGALLWRPVAGELDEAPRFDRSVTDRPAEGDREELESRADDPWADLETDSDHPPGSFWNSPILLVGALLFLVGWGIVHVLRTRPPLPQMGAQPSEVSVPAPEPPQPQPTVLAPEPPAIPAPKPPPEPSTPWPKRLAQLKVSVIPTQSLVQLDDLPPIPFPFRFEGLSPGPHHIVVSCQGYSSTERAVTVQAGAVEVLPLIWLTRLPPVSTPRPPTVPLNGLSSTPGQGQKPPIAFAAQGGNATISVSSRLTQIVSQHLDAVLGPLDDPRSDTDETPLVAEPANPIATPKKSVFDHRATSSYFRPAPALAATPLPGVVIRNEAKPIYLPRQEIVQLKEDVRDEATKASAESQSIYAAAVLLCDSLLAAIQQRETELHRLNDAKATPTKRKDPNGEFYVDSNRLFFIRQIRTRWTEEAKAHRQAIEKRQSDLRAAERQVATRAAGKNK